MSSTQPDSIERNARDERIGQLLNDFVDRRARGEPVSAARLLADHPDLADELRAHLELLRELRPGSDRIEDLIRQGLLTLPTDPRYMAELGAYKILGFIGRGGMGIVLKAYEESLNRTIALKILRPELADDVAALTRFEREAKAAAALRHPNIVTVYAIGRECGVPFIAMEYVDGPSLASVIRGGWQPELGSTPADAAESPAEAVRPLDPKLSLASAPCRLQPARIRRIFRELLAGLDAAHQAGLVHRDIKSSNILLDLRPSSASGGARDRSPWTTLAGGSAPPCPPSLDPIVKVADFGLARMRSSQTQITLAQSVLGTPEYMSPEQARGETDLDQRADLYSAGVVLYEMLTGRTPFAMDSPTAIIHRILYEEPAEPRRMRPDVDPNLASLALRLMAKRPDDRFATAAEALAALDAGHHVNSRESGRRRRRRAGRLLGAVALLAACIVASRALLPQTATTTARPQIREVRIDPAAARTILARYEGDPTWRVFRDEFPTEVARVTAVKLIELDAGGRNAVIAGLDLPRAAPNLAAYEADTGRELWTVELARPWPGSDPGEPWSVSSLTSGDLGHGEALLVTAHMNQSYACRLSVVDQRNGVVRTTFWNMGHLTRLLVAPDFLGAGRPALLVWGYNNKLDEFPVSVGEQPRASYDLVTALLILDPNEMNGLGPPLVDGVPDLPRARPYAGAFLNLPPSAQGTYIPPGQTRRVQPLEEMFARIADVLIPAQVTPGLASSHLIVGIGRSAPGGAVLALDQHLNVLRATASSGEIEGTDPEYWRAHWVPFIQDGRSVPPPDSAAAAISATTSNTAEPESAGPLTAVWIDKLNRNVVLARRGLTSAPTRFHEFPPDTGTVSRVVLVNPEGRRPAMVVVGLARPVEDHALFAFDETGAELWRLDLSSDLQWPDCGPPSKWGCVELIAAELDNEPGQELIAVVKDCYEYPTRLAIIDPRSHAVRSSFWHMGEVYAISVAADFFGPGHPALLAAGLNNKLDGFAEPAASDDPPCSQYDYTGVAMILDPRNMDGLGPPRSRRLPELPAARPYAYAYLDRPPVPSVSFAPAEGGPRVAAPSSETVAIRNLSIGPYAPTDDTAPWMLVSLEQGPAGPGLGYLVVDRHLAARQLIVSSGVATPTTLEYWQRYWHPIIQRGQYVRE